MPRRNFGSRHAGARLTYLVAFLSEVPEWGDDHRHVAATTKIICLKMGKIFPWLISCYYIHIYSLGASFVESPV